MNEKKYRKSTIKLTIIGLVILPILFFSLNFIFVDTGKVNYDNSDNNGNICINCDNPLQKITYIEESGCNSPDYHPISYGYKEGFPYYTDKMLLIANVKFYIESVKEWFVIPEYNFTHTYEIGRCNSEYTDCCIYDKYNLKNYINEPICFEATDAEDSLIISRISDDPECDVVGINYD